MSEPKTRKRPAAAKKPRAKRAAVQGPLMFELFPLTTVVKIALMSDASMVKILCNSGISPARTKAICNVLKPYADVCELLWQAAISQKNVDLVYIMAESKMILASWIPPIYHIQDVMVRGKTQYDWAGRFIDFNAFASRCTLEWLADLRAIVIQEGAERDLPFLTEAMLKANVFSLDELDEFANRLDYRSRLLEPVKNSQVAKRLEQALHRVADEYEAPPRQ